MMPSGLVTRKYSECAGPIAPRCQSSYGLLLDSVNDGMHLRPDFGVVLKVEKYQESSLALHPAAALASLREVVHFFLGACERSRL